jgi:hypothetical protein
MKLFTDQLALNVIAPIDPNKIKELENILVLIENDVENNNLLPFKKMLGVHFARFVIIPAYEDPNGNSTPIQLAYSTNYDGSLEEHLNQICGPLTLPGFFSVFSCCIAFESSIPAAQAVRNFIFAWKHKVHTFYRGHRGFSVNQIRSESAIHKEIQKYLDAFSYVDLPIQKLKQKIEDHIFTQFPDWKRPQPVSLTTLSVPVAIIAFVGLPLLILLTGGFLLKIFWLVLIIFLLILLLSIVYLRYLEKNAVQLERSYSNFEKVTELTTREDKIIQNQLTVLVPLQTGLFRKILQLIALWLLNKLATYTYNQGRLGDIATIHFARWLIIDNGKRLLFFSNFDGSWENYLGDFVDRAAPGLTLAWSNTFEFPRTRFLISKGAKDEERFKNWARKYQVFTQVWYSAYPDLTVKNILRNRAIVSGLGKPMDIHQVKEWLTLL